MATKDGIHADLNSDHKSKLLSNLCFRSVSYIGHALDIKGMVAIPHNDCMRGALGKAVKGIRAKPPLVVCIF